MAKVFLILVTSFFILGMTESSLAMMCHGQAGEQQIAQHEHSGYNKTENDAVTKATVKEAVNVGNKICSVSGEKVGQGGMEPATYEYEGKIYNFCCSACIEEFKKDPQKYIEKVEEELKGQPPVTQESGQMHEEQVH